MGERLSIEEIRRRYDGEWVTLVDVEEVPDTFEILSGRVIAHDLDGDALYDQIGRIQPKSFADECFKSLPEGWGLAL